ncbi:Poly(rC)-binding protein 3 [Pseudolycoriella hygida]|uniref:Poly(RC)-binding protein 3 n=1 Tax=Pseudolycoriella hygida TaxID=35572 RepID=A0A9Q0N6Z1_9DIPT|nr:Poly(rC)-binding protein 3 [Pseudolycoriella hygida]
MNSGLIEAKENITLVGIQKYHKNKQLHKVIWGEHKRNTFSTTLYDCSAKQVVVAGKLHWIQIVVVDNRGGSLVVLDDEGRWVENVVATIDLHRMEAVVVATADLNQTVAVAQTQFVGVVVQLRFVGFVAENKTLTKMDESNAMPNINIKDDPSVKLTIRLIMQGKGASMVELIWHREVGSIIGKKGEIVKRFREESGATINISDGSCPERIVTVSGSNNAIFKAFSLITKKFEEWCSQFNENGTSGGGGKTQIPIRLIVPASQCGSLIGKGGSKIKEIRDTTGCSVQVASEMLPNSTERAVTLSGSAGQITQCIYHICCVMLESPPKGATIPYRPKPQVNGPLILANGTAYAIQGNYAVPTQETCTVYPLALAGGLHAGISGLADPLLKGTHLSAAMPPHHLQHIHDMGGLAKNPLASLAALGLAGMAPSNTGGLNPTGGTKIAEIRHISGAMIRISNCEEREGGNTDRTITISGNPDSVALAQYLINMRISMETAGLPIPGYHYIAPNHIVKSPIH